MIGAILMNTVPAITIKSASRGVPRITSAPKRAMSYLLVILVAISTKQHERPKLKGQMEFFRPQARRSCNRASTRLRRTSSWKELFIPADERGSLVLLNHHFIILRAENFRLST